MKELKVIKIGGNIVDNEEALNDFVVKFAALDGPKVLIHGGGVLASRMASQMGLETKMINGRRVTDIETLKLVTMVYAGWCNKTIVAKLQNAGCNAIGLSGADACAVPAKKRSPIPVDYGFVGDVDTTAINSASISALVENGFTPVFCAITYDGQGGLLNTNADTMAQSIATAMASAGWKVSLTFCFEKNGVLDDVNNPESVIPLITRATADDMISRGKIADGMIPKIENAFAAIRSGVSEVVIKHAANLNRDLQTIIR